MKQEGKCEAFFFMLSGDLPSNGCEGALHYYTRRKRIKERAQKR